MKRWFWKVGAMLCYIYDGGYTAGWAWDAAECLTESYYPDYSPRKAYLEELSYQ